MYANELRLMKNTRLQAHANQYSLIYIFFLNSNPFTNKEIEEESDLNSRPLL